MNTSEWTVNEPQTIDVDGVRDIRAAVVDGRADILVHEEATTHVEVSEVHGAPIAITFEDGVLNIRHRPPFSRGPLKGLVTGTAEEYAVISVAVPAGTAVSLHTVNGDGLVCGTTRTSLDTVTGSVMADDTTGHLTAKTVSGEVIVRHHTGTLVAKSVSGEVTASGFLDSIRTNSVSGNISIDVLGSPRDLGAKSVSGDLTVQLPDEVAIDLAATTASGTATVNDRKLSGRGKIVHSEAGTSPQTFTMRTNSVSGNVVVFHRPRSGPRQPGAEQYGGAR